MKDKIIFLEFEDDVRQLLKERKEINDSYLIIALSPSPILLLERFGLSYKCPHHYIDSKKIHQKTQDLYLFVEKFCDFLDQQLKVSYAKSSFYFLKILFDSPIEKIMHVSLILAVEKPKEVIYFGSSRRRYTPEGQPYDERTSIYSTLIPLIMKGENPGIKIKKIIRKPDLWRGAKLILSSAKRRIKFLYSFSSQYKYVNCSDKAHKKICVIEAGYQIREILPIVGKNHDLIMWYPESYLHVPMSFNLRYLSQIIKNRSRFVGARKKIREHWRRTIELKEFKDFFVYNGIDFSEVCDDVLDRLITHVFPQLAILEKMCEVLFKKENVGCVLSVYFSNPFTYMVAIVARRRNIPVVTYQHSAYGYFHWPIAKYIDGVMADFKMVGGDGVKHYVEEVERSGCKPVVTGLIHIEKLRRKPLANGESRKGNARPLILYPLTGYLKNNFYFGNHHFSVTEYFDLNRKIISVLSEADYADVVIKPHPAQAFKVNDFPFQDWIKSKRWTHVRVVDDVSLPHLASIANLIVMDSPTTSFLQCSLSNAKIILYQGIFKLLFEAIPLIRKRVVYYDDLDEFLEFLKHTIRKRDFHNSDFENEEFINSYGLHLNDGRSAERISETIELICNNDFPFSQTFSTAS